MFSTQRRGDTKIFRETDLFIRLRPEGAEAHSPGHRPGGLCQVGFIRPVRAKALIHIRAFALTGRNNQYPST